MQPYRLNKIITNWFGYGSNSLMTIISIQFNYQHLHKLIQFRLYSVPKGLQVVYIQWYMLLLWHCLSTWTGLVLLRFYRKHLKTGSLPLLMTMKISTNVHRNIKAILAMDIVIKLYFMYVFTDKFALRSQYFLSMAIVSIF